LGQSLNLKTIQCKTPRASLTPLETAFVCAWVKQGNWLNQRCDFAQRYDEYQALDDETKTLVDLEMIMEENQVFEPEHVAIQGLAAILYKLVLP